MFNSMRISQLLHRDPDEETINAEGWIRTKRDSKNFCFFEMNDGSSLKNLQVILDKQDASVISTIQAISTGASVRFTGILVESPGKNQKVELQAKTVELVGDAPVDTYPLQKKRHSFEFLREIAHLRPRTNTFGAVTRVRNALSYAVHSFFQEKGFLYIHTPIITTSDCEGAGEMFQVTTLPLNQVPKEEGKEGGKVDFSKDFFGKPANLTVSGQLEAEIYALALKNVYTFGPTFRAENSNTSRHLSEFWMVEPEMAFCTLDGDMALAEEFLKYIFSYVLNHCEEDMDFFNKWIQKGVKDSLEHVVNSKFTHLPYTEAIKELERSKQDFEFPVSWGDDLQSEHERYLTETVFKGPVTVTDYPREIKAFYMRLNDDEKTVRAMDVLVPRLGEIIGGSERENRYDVLLRRIKEQGLNEKDYWWYLDLRRYGSVPHAGFGLGFERVIQYVTGMQNIRDVIPFPRTVQNAEF
ncbi:MAG: asparagine--tRNA ligase [Spirochaetia bacterium]|nr:asparagine--tRNA ligase [Spirochaetia bacterium]MCF7946742.1 asparagine--tRNA ligase [Spirochaetia bacterium]MCF7952454.1 asparagine--tRNA ligase [Spirochaetales bacterium]